MKVLASDFDKTLYIDDNDNFDKNINMINAFIKNGNIFILITGRSYFDIKPLLNKYNIIYTYLICEDGAKIYNSNDYCISTISIDSEKVETIIEISKNYNLNCLLDDGYNYTDNINDCVKIDISYTDWNSACEFLKTVKDKINIYGYISRHYINITDKDVNKCNALIRLCELENIDSKYLNVIGDDVNDYEMIKYFNGYVIENCTSILDSLNRPVYKYLYLLIEELLNK